MEQHQQSVKYEITKARLCPGMQPWSECVIDTSVINAPTPE